MPCDFKLKERESLELYIINLKGTSVFYTKDKAGKIKI